jgi:hypothetical protein
MNLLLLYIYIYIYIKTLSIQSSLSNKVDCNRISAHLGIIILTVTVIFNYGYDLYI